MEAQNIRKAWCLFEQSGTFKNEFLKLGIPAVDVDIQNNFNQTDYVLDLFAEIDKEYDRLTDETRRDETRRDEHILCHRFLSRPCHGLFPLHLFRDNVSNVFFFRYIKQPA